MTDDLFKEDDDDIHKVGTVDKDFHKLNQKTYKFKIDYDSKIGYYSTRLSIDLVYLPVGYYTMIFELYPSNKIDLDEITVNVQSGTLSVSKINTKKSSSHTSGQGKFFPSHTRSVINFYKAVIYPSLDDLDIDIALKNKVGESYDADTQIFVVVYGVAGTQNDVESLVWDRFYYIDNQKVYFEAPLDMKNHDITNVNNLSFSNYFNMNNKNIKFLQDGVEDGDAVNIKQINEVESNVAYYANCEIQKVNTNVSNNSNMIERILKYLIRKETPFSLIKELYFPDSLEGTTQNYYTYRTTGSNKGDVTFYLTFVHQATTSDTMIIAFQWSSFTGNIYIYVTKDIVEFSINPLANEPYLKIKDIPKRIKENNYGSG